MCSAVLKFNVKVNIILLLRGTIVNRTYDTVKTKTFLVYIYLFLLTIFGPI